MNVGGITTKLMDAARNCVGHKKGGLAMLRSSFRNPSAIIGAAQAVVGILCSLYSRNEKGWISGTVQQCSYFCSQYSWSYHSPSVIFVVYAARADVSIKGLFMAGITPGILIAIGLPF